MPYKIYFRILIFISLISFQSCCLFGTKNTSLGNGFKISEYSHKELQIMYCYDNCCNSGLTVIPETLIAYNYDKNWIIAKSDSTYYNGQNDFAYWVFKKDTTSSKKDMSDRIKANLIGPLDSTTFYRVISENNINLQLITYLK